MTTRKLRKHGRGHPNDRVHARMRRRMRAAVAVCGLALGAVSPLHAQVLRKASAEMRAGSQAVESRWRESLEGFAASDREHAPAPGGVVFVGSSSIRLWNGLENEFGATTVVKRGFGGSRLSDCARYVAQLVLPYRPRTVVVYAGDNDLAEGQTAQGVLASYTELVERIREALPETRIVYISIKPSPSRAALMPVAIQANELIEAYSKTRPGLVYVDVFTKMIDAGGRPRAELFQADALHLNAAGYALWKAAVAEHLR